MVFADVAVQALFLRDPRGCHYRMMERRFLSSCFEFLTGA